MLQQFDTWDRQRSVGYWVIQMLIANIVRLGQGITSAGELVVDAENLPPWGYH